MGRRFVLRRWLLGGAAVLVAALAGLIGYARHRARAALLDLPRLLGLNIKSETDGYTYSQTVSGRTLFTIHAAKAIQHNDGKTTLRNVAVTLYGEPGSNRVDRIRGAEFEYDQANGVVRAIGESQIDLASPAVGAQPDAKRIQVVANGLVFQQKQGTATTDDLIHFTYGTMQGMARGADFDSHSGMLQLRHDVHVVSTGSGQAQKIDADAALLDRRERTALMQRATLTQAGQSLRAQQMLVKLRPEAAGAGGSIESVHGSGGVEVRTAGGAVVDAPVLDASVTAQNKVHEADMTGGVRMHGAEGEGRSGRAVLLFDDAGRVSHARLTEAVDLQQAAAAGGGRELEADAVDGTLGSDAGGHAMLKDSVATGNASLRIDDPAAAGRAGKTTTLGADTLRAFGTPVNGRWQARRVVGEGSTRVEELQAGVDDRTSTGARVEILLAPVAAVPVVRGGQQAGSGQIDSFVQQGRVRVVDRRAAAGGRAASESVAEGDRAEYTASAGTVVLTGGSPTVWNETMQVAADRISVLRETGDAEASGDVKGTYTSAQKAGAASVQRASADRDGTVHFLSDRAVTDRSAKQATLFGGARPVRLWNGASQVEAPVIEIDQAKGSLFAHGVAGSRAVDSVRTVLPAESGTGVGAKKSGDGPVRVLSNVLRYRQAEAAAPATAEFTGAVRVDSSSGQILSDRAVAVLRKEAGRDANKDSNGASVFTPSSGASMSGSVDSVTAEGGVRVQQPGRTATGTRLVYTAASQQYLLTGSPGALPVVRDSAQGTVTGTALLFHSGDDSVEVTGAAGQPVRTDVAAPPRKAARQAVPGQSGTGQESAKPDSARPGESGTLPKGAYSRPVTVQKN